MTERMEHYRRGDPELGCGLMLLAAVAGAVTVVIAFVVLVFLT